MIQTELADAGAVTQESQEQETVPEENQQQEAEGEENEQQEAVLQKVRATTVVNIRSSDNEAADKKGQAQTGQEFILLEQQGNGWSKVKLTDGEGYIKSEYLQAVSDTDAESTPSEASSNSEAKTVTVIENVNVRKSASENAERLGLVYMGEKLELIMKQADGWTKVKYKGQTAYVKSEYVK
ncbi:MAG: SH3 domain-containing protein [Lachnospiraceae bacterium]|nr:SH3 domain-containing protein [Lachnospiraceae bacterium]